MCRMRLPPNPTNRLSGSNRPATPGQQVAASPAPRANRPIPAVSPNSLPIPVVRPPATASPNKAAVQSRGALPRALPNRPSRAVTQRTPLRSIAAASSKAPNYTVQAPIHLGGSQQIRATIQGTPQVAGSVEISSAGSGKAYISNLTVDQQHRRRGVAAKLIDAAISTALRQGFNAASLAARPYDNRHAPQILSSIDWRL